LKLVDFGLSVVLDNGLQTSGTCGSPGFIAPEMYRGEEYGREIDMFSFGAILFLMMSGEKPFRGNEKVVKQKTLQLAYHVDQGNWTASSHNAKNLVRKLLVFREERLDASQALGHEWFEMADDSHAMVFPTYGKSRRILQLVSASLSSKSLNPVTKLSTLTHAPSSSRNRRMHYQNRIIESTVDSGSILWFTRHWAGFFHPLVDTCIMGHWQKIANLLLLVDLLAVVLFS
jgi:serine/threonine protein kinase